MTSKLPKVLHVYQNHTIDSTRWHHYKPREDDVIVATSYKSGTTWMQHIVNELIFLGQSVPNMWEVAFWLDSRFHPNVQERIDIIEAQQHRRSLKTHLALDGLPFYPQVKYIVVARDVRDVFMSWWNHYSNYTDEMYERTNNLPGRVGPPLPRCPEDIHLYWRQWISQGWFEWEIEGYPQWGNMHHTQSWWNYRHLDNILFVHFNDLLADLPGEIKRVATFLNIAVTAEDVEAVEQAVQFDVLRQQATADPQAGTDTWKGGMATFFHRGTNGRWCDVLSAAEIAMYEATATKVLTPACQRWLEQGRIALG